MLLFVFSLKQNKTNDNDRGGKNHGRLRNDNKSLLSAL